MKIRNVCLLVASLASSGPVIAGCGVDNTYLNVAQVNAVLAGNYACGQSSKLNPPGWNERHVVGGSLVEQHEGGTTVETVGTWAVNSSPGGRGRVSYSYVPGGAAPVYEVARVSEACQGASCTTLPQTYQFCGVGGGAPAVLNIFVSATFQAPTFNNATKSWTMNANCPANP